MRIESVKHGRKKLTHTVIDGETYSFDTETFMMFGIVEGGEISFEKFKELYDTSNRNRAYEKALYLLDYRDRTFVEIKRKLSAEYPPEAVEYALERVCQMELIDDEQFARRFAAELYNFKNYGKKRIESELFRRGVDKDIIDTVLAEIEDSPVEKISEIIERKFTSA